tara:strand:- start:700 stop:903 length:204 start_codon:yes stop_codon:yes gene_type:complete
VKNAHCGNSQAIDAGWMGKQSHALAQQWSESLIGEDVDSQFDVRPVREASRLTLKQSLESRIGILGN